ncbi:restriction endonuclease subunit S [Acinetobacter faecalis]|uniref:restriction endonuclease subunit S n=1 Tax=Acinetobacter faecalis TaxID=2665161 RepID=UPI002A90F0B2|nr:restriction endonuclease subunit S [Acinetobacter faecalis]MDY6451447.1 restriction endonuclease subunit S [Acinetobacter faecalis]
MAKYEKYVEYKDSGVEWLEDVPKEWDIIKIKHLSSVKRGASPRPIDDPKYFDDNGEYAWVRIADVSASDTYLLNTPQTMSELGSSLSVKLEPNELFLSIAGTVGKPCINKIKACIHDGFVYFPELKIPNKFLFYVFAGEQAYKGLGKMGTQLNLNTDTVGDIKVALPKSIDDIQNIVDFLDHETAKIDSLIAKQEKLIELLKEKRQAVISHAVTKGLNSDVTMKDSGVEWLGQVPEHWEIPKLLHITTRIGDGLHSTPLYQEGTGYYFINGNNLVDGQILIGETAKEVPESEFIKHQVTLDNTTVLLSINGTIGKVALFNNEPVILGKSASYMNCCPELVPSFLANYLTTSQAKNYYDLEVTGTTIYNLSLNSIRNMKIPLPPIDEQNSIVVFVAEQYSKYEKLIQSSEKQNELLKERRTALISSAVTGKIDVRNWQNPNKNNDAKTELGV